MSQDTADKRLPATARKLDKAREQGQVPRSRDLVNFAGLAAGFGLLVLAGPWLYNWLREMLALGLRFDAQMLAQPDVLTQHLTTLGLRMLLLVIPMGLVMLSVGAWASASVGGWNFTWSALEPKFEKFNPITGLGNVFRKDQLVETLKRCAQALVLLLIGSSFLYLHLLEFTALTGLDLQAALATVAAELQGGVVWMLGFLALVALIDVPLQRHFFAERMKMSFEEVKQEFKEAEGNQEVKGKIKVKMREASRRRMLAAVPQADLVVMNPTHYAVALKYEEGRMAAPKVVAKGADLLALAIRDKAQEHRVPVLQAPPLARALYVHAELDREVPAPLFAAVAQVLAYVYQLRAALAGQAPSPDTLQPLALPPGLDPLEAPTPERSDA